MINTSLVNLSAKARQYLLKQFHPALVGDALVGYRDAEQETLVVYPNLRVYYINDNRKTIMRFMNLEDALDFLMI